MVTIVASGKQHLHLGPLHAFLSKFPDGHSFFFLTQKPPALVQALRILHFLAQHVHLKPLQPLGISSSLAALHFFLHLPLAFAHFPLSLHCFAQHLQVNPPEHPLLISRCLALHFFLHLPLYLSHLLLVLQFSNLQHVQEDPLQ